MQRPDPALLLADPDAVEAGFYEALREGDLERLMSLWAEDEQVLCVHPSGGRLLGLAAIRASFAPMLEGRGLDIRAQEVRRLRSGGLAAHHVTERIQAPARAGGHVLEVQATNLYLLTARGWRMVAHHASPGRVGDARADMPPAQPPPPGQWH